MSKRTARTTLVSKTEPKKPGQLVHLPADAPNDERRTMLEKLVGQSCSGCKQLFTEHSLLAEPGRPVVVDMQNDERPVLYTCVVCTYFYARHDCWYDKENISRPFFAPLNQSGARTMIYKLVGPFREEPRIVVVIPTVEAL